LSYLTIEKRGPIPRELRKHVDEWAFGCDLCSEVCPWGSSAPDRGGVWGESPLARAPLVSWMRGSEARAEELRGSPLRRAGPEGLARNAAIVLGNRPSEEGRLALLQALDMNPSPTVREAAAWSLVRGHAADRESRAALDRALTGDPAEEVRQGLRASLDQGA
jgi:epoxyqueuosine reductase QueG